MSKLMSSIKNPGNIPLLSTSLTKLEVKSHIRSVVIILLSKGL